MGIPGDGFRRGQTRGGCTLGIREFLAPGAGRIPLREDSEIRKSSWLDHVAAPNSPVRLFRSPVVRST
eukprot:1179678-Prorocentrum_minimum.AAC.2